METNYILQLLEEQFLVSGSGSMNLTGPSTTGIGSTITTTPLTGNSTYIAPSYFNGPIISTEEESKVAIDQIGRLMDKLCITEDENQLNAVKHLTYAKAFLEKMLLDKINEKTNGDS